MPCGYDKEEKYGGYSVQYCNVGYERTQICLLLYPSYCLIITQTQSSIHMIIIQQGFQISIQKFKLNFPFLLRQTLISQNHIAKMQNDSLKRKQLQLERRNQQLEERKREIQRQLKSLSLSNDHDEEQQESNNSNNYQSNTILEQQNQEQLEKDDQKDIINQLESIKKATLQKNLNNLTRLKKLYESNKTKINKNQQRLNKLQNNIQLAKSAVNMKNQLKQQIESKGKKLSEESKKWISEVSKLNDKSEALRTTLVGVQKEQESLKTIFESSQRKLAQIQKQKVSYEAENKSISGKLEGLKGEIQKAKQLIKQKQIVSKQQSQKSQKQKQKQAVNQKRLQRQKNELIKAYKKLSQYIALLRKCNTHLQTANSLGFTLKEYLQAIDKSDMIA